MEEVGMGIVIARPKRVYVKNKKEGNDFLSSTSILALSGFSICQISDKKSDPFFPARKKTFNKYFLF
jgi:hypothetical protein